MKDINCFKEKEPFHAALELLTQRIKLVSESEDKPSVPDNDETADAVPHEMMKIRKVIAILTLTKALFDYWLRHVVLSIYLFHKLLLKYVLCY